jgi:hypothetical protein
VITENGVSAPKEQDMRVQDATRDSFRVDYYRSGRNRSCELTQCLSTLSTGCSVLHNACCLRFCLCVQLMRVPAPGGR